tara:strand:+ start:23 stop:538 length:516 start_codon:yes stop_codon:yes gene_type:complete
MAIYYGDGTRSDLGRLIAVHQTAKRNASTYDIGAPPSFTGVMAITVTPTDSSTIHLIQWNCCYSINGGTTMGCRLLANTGSGNVIVDQGNTSGNRTRVTTAWSVKQTEHWNQDVGNVRYVHGTSNNISYTLDVNSHDGRAFSINRSYSDSNSAYLDNARSISTLTVWEFSG